MGVPNMPALVEAMFKIYTNPAAPSECRCTAVKNDLNKLGSLYSIKQDMVFPALQKVLKDYMENKVDFIARKLVAQMLVDGCRQFAQAVNDKQFKEIQKKEFQDLNEASAFENVFNWQE